MLCPAFTPTTHLPTIKSLQSSTPSEILGHLDALKRLYNPPVRGSRRKHQPPVLDSAGDPFERTYAIRWLTAVVAQVEIWVEDDLEFENTDSTGYIQTDGEMLHQRAVSLLALCSGTAAAGVVEREFVFATGTQEDITIQLRDVQLDGSLSSVGAQTWGGAVVLSEMVVKSPSDFGLNGLQFRALELGAGTGLVCIAAAKVACLKLGQHATFVATDFHPPVLDNLKSNIYANIPQDTQTVSVDAEYLDWSALERRTTTPSSLDTGPFDVIFGADIVYEPEHAALIKSTVQRFLRHSLECGTPSPAFHLVVPIRSTHDYERDIIWKLFGAPESPLREPYLVITHHESILCEGDDPGDEDVQYGYYKIQWGQVHV